MRTTKLPRTAAVFVLALVPVGCLSDGGGDASGSPTVTEARARAAETSERWELAAELWHDLYLSSGGRNLDAYLGCGRSLLALGDLRSACAIVERGIEVYPVEPDLLALYAEVLDAAGFHRAAEGQWEEVIHLEPERRDAYLGLGRTRVQLGLSHQALSPLQTAIELDPADPQALRLLARAAESAGEAELAFRSRRRLLALVPDATGREYAHAARLAFHPDVRAAEPRSLEIARPWIERAIELDPQEADAHFLRARDMELRGEPDLARASYRRAIEVDPGHVEALSGLAEHLHAAGDQEGADRFARMALRLETDDRRRERLEELIDD